MAHESPDGAVGFSLRPLSTIAAGGSIASLRYPEISVWSIGVFPTELHRSKPLILSWSDGYIRHLPISEHSGHIGRMLRYANEAVFRGRETSAWWPLRSLSHAWAS